LAVALLCAAAGVTADLAARELYIYQEKDGTRWFTDHRVGNQDFKLIARYGRPTATKSCYGVNERRMARRAEPWLPTVKSFAAEYDVDATLIKAIITVESCFDTHAVSRVGAQGLMQLMPTTATELGVRNAFDPIANIQGGVSYFRQMLDRFESDVELALAAYNAGPNAVERYGGIPPYQETQKYVQRVLKHYDRYRAALETETLP
jgi:soluble lytic murein transglycosylase-like protein